MAVFLGSFRAWRGAVTVACGALLVHFQLDRHLSAECRGAERDLDLHLDVLTPLGAARPRTWAPSRGSTAEHRAKQIADSADPDIAKILEPE